MYNYKLIKDSMTGKITDIHIDGKPVKRGFMRGFRKAQDTVIFKEYASHSWATNPFSGVHVLLNPLEMTIYAFCVRWYKAYERGEMVTPIQTYDDMKYFLLEINSEAYMELLD